MNQINGPNNTQPLLSLIVFIWQRIHFWLRLNEKIRKKAISNYLFLLIARLIYYVTHIIFFADQGSAFLLLDTKRVFRKVK